MRFAVPEEQNNFFLNTSNSREAEGEFMLVWADQTFVDPFVTSLDHVRPFGLDTAHFLDLAG